jgi:hypothetical protein
MFDNRAMRRIYGMYGPERKKVTGGWRGRRKLQDSEHNNYQTKQDEMGRTGSTHGVKEITYKIVVGEVKRKKMLKCRYRCEDNASIAKI